MEETMDKNELRMDAKMKDTMNALYERFDAMVDKKFTKLEKSVDTRFQELCARMDAQEQKTDKLEKGGTEYNAWAKSSFVPRPGRSSTRQPPSKRPHSADGRESSEETKTVILKDFPYQMWRTKLIDLAKIACNIPDNKVSYRAFDNTKFVKLDFINHADANKHR